MDLVKRASDGVDCLIDLLACDHERRLDADHVTVNASNTDQHACGEAVVADSFGLYRGGGALVVLHQLDADHQAKAADLADYRNVSLQLVQAILQVCPFFERLIA